MFKHSARPAALSKREGEETEGSGGGWGSHGMAYPFPQIAVGFQSSPSPLAGGGGRTTFEIDAMLSSPVPSPSLGSGNVHLENLLFSPDTMNLSGTVLVRNLVYSKVVAVRFTLDEWDTTCEVLSNYVVSLHCLPSSSLSSSASTSTNTEGWDRFRFSIRLEDYEHNLSERTMWLAVRYMTEGGGEGKEWWDNNEGGNYRVGFRCAPSPSLPASPEGGRGRERKRHVALSGPRKFSFCFPFSFVDKFLLDF